MLSVFRLILVPVFICAFFLLPREQYYWLAVILFVSGFTDVLDGFIARKFNQITQLGKVLDPAADKITVAALSLIHISGFRRRLWNTCSASPWLGSSAAG